MSPNSVKRAHCVICGYPASHCICHLIQPVAGDVQVWILQDKQEAKHAKNTARLFSLCYPNTRIINVEDREQLISFYETVNTAQALLLYPSAQANTMETLEPNHKADIRHLVLLDGTWRKAKKMLLSESKLAMYQQVCFADAPVSKYDIRKSPSREALSTLEAAVYALECLGNNQVAVIQECFVGVLALQWAQQPIEHKHISQ